MEKIEKETDTLMLPLRLQKNKDSTKDNLPIRIAQINAQRGSFRNITEESLQEEIKAQKAKQKDKDNGKDDEAEDATKESAAELDMTERHELLYKRRTEIVQFATQAYTEAQFALDFISLLLSKHTPRQAETSISPYLKQNVPMGSLNVDVIKAVQKSESSIKDSQNVARGWRMESFNAAANRLLKAASRLESEVAAETKYWDEVLSIKDKGWKLCRLPRERQVLGVQYGFMEATPTFRDRGLASLRRADDGTLVLDKGLVPSRARAVRVQVRKQGKIVGSSGLCSFVAAAVADDSVEKTILQSRDTLFEEELFHELTREARVLVSSGVTVHKDLIEFEYEAGEEILLDLVNVDDINENNNTDTTEDNVAEAIAHALRILLSYAHRQNLLRRTQLPAPLANQKRPTPQYQLLRPILSYMQHSAHVRSLQSFLHDVYQVLKSAGLSSSHTKSKFSSLRFNNKDLYRIDSSSSEAIESLLGPFMQPLESRFSGSMANQTSTFNIRINTSMPDTSSRQTSALGTDYEVTIRLPNFPYTQPPSRIGLKQEVEQLLLKLFTLDVITYISSLSSQNAAKAAEEGAPSLKDEGDKDITSPSKDDKAIPLVWEAPFPHHGELIGVTRTGQRLKQLAIDLSRDSLGLRVASTSNDHAVGATKQVNDEEKEKYKAESGNDDDAFESEFITGAGGLRFTRPPQRLMGGEAIYVWKNENEEGASSRKKTLADVIEEVSKQ